MEIENFKKIQEEKAIEVCQRFELQNEVKMILKETDTPASFFEKLIQGEHYIDAVRFLAYGMPKRESIWWSYLCAYQVEKAIDIDKNKLCLIIKILEGVKRWVYNPNEEDRFAVKEAAEALQFKASSSWVAMAVFWSGGSVNPPEDPKVEPGKYLTAQAVAGAISLAAVLYNPEKAKEKYKRFLEQGINIANGGNGEI